MLLKNLISAVVAAAVSHASPIESGMEGVHDVQVFRRDAPLSARDLQLAEMHSVDVNEMYKHTVYKRHDGDDITIWVHNSFVEDTDVGISEAPDKRALKSQYHYSSDPNGKMCSNYHDWAGDTGTWSPTTGGPNEMIQWAKSRKGVWSFTVLPASDLRRYHNLVVAGSNGGANARLEAKRTHGDLYGWIGTYDVAEVVRGAVNRFQKKINGKWMVGASGKMDCTALPPQGLFDARQRMSWQLKRYDSHV